MSLGSLKLSRKDSTEVAVSFETISASDPRKLSLLVYEGSNYSSIASLLVDNAVIRCFTNLSGFDLDAGEAAPARKIDHIGRYLIGCAIETFYGEQLTVSATGSHWCYVRFGFEAAPTIKNQQFERFVGLNQKCKWIFGKNGSHPIWEEEYLKKRKIRAEELGCEEESLTWQQVCWAKYAEMPAIFRQAQKRGEKLDDLSYPVAMQLSWRGFDQWTSHIITSPLTKDQELINQLQIKVLCELEKIAFEDKVQKTILDYLIDAKESAHAKDVH